MTIIPKFKIGEIVYSITDPEQNARMVTGYTIRKNGLISYLVTFIDCERQFEDFELSSEKIFR
jgi:hypothetical protein